MSAADPAGRPEPDVIRARQRVRQSQLSVPTAAMAGLVLLLVTIVLVVYRPDVDRALVDLPRTIVCDTVPRGAAVISIDRGGMMRASAGVDASAPVANVDELERFVADVVSRDPTRPFVIKADRNTRYELVDRVIAALRASRAGAIYLLAGQRLIDEVG